MEEKRQWLFISYDSQEKTCEGVLVGLSPIFHEIEVLLREFTYLDVKSVQQRYGNEFIEICIIPTCLDDHLWEILGWKERILIRRKKCEADIRLRMDFDSFVKANHEEKKEQYVGILIKSIQALQGKSKQDFRGDLLIKDILQLLGMEYLK